MVVLFSAEKSNATRRNTPQHAATRRNTQIAFTLRQSKAQENWRVVPVL